MKLGELLEDIRKEKGLTLEEAAKRIDVSKMTYIRLEKDSTKKIEIGHIFNITNYLEVDFFKIAKALGKGLINIDIKSASKGSRRLLYNNTLINNEKLEKLIEENIEYLKL